MKININGFVFLQRFMSDNSIYANTKPHYKIRILQFYLHRLKLLCKKKFPSIYRFDHKFHPLKFESHTSKFKL